MAKHINFKALRATVTVSRKKDARWDFQNEKSGHEPPDAYSLRGDLVSAGTEKLFKLQETLGPPPADLIFRVEEEWSVLE
jgi:hypothetical protein